jgi:hypothetical protein
MHIADVLVFFDIKFEIKCPFPALQTIDMYTHKRQINHEANSVFKNIKLYTCQGLCKESGANECALLLLCEISYRTMRIYRVSFYDFINRNKICSKFEKKNQHQKMFITKGTAVEFGFKINMRSKVE